MSLYLDNKAEKAAIFDFSGGINRFDDAAQLQDNEYQLLRNGRARNGSVRPVKLPVRVLDGLPQGTGESVITTTTTDTIPNQTEISITIRESYYTANIEHVILDTIVLLVDNIDKTSEARISVEGNTIVIRYTHGWLQNEVHRATVSWEQTVNINVYNSYFIEKVFGSVNPFPLQFNFQESTADPIIFPSVRITIDGIDVTAVSIFTPTGTHSGVFTNTPTLSWTVGQEHLCVITWAAGSHISTTYFLLISENNPADSVTIVTKTIQQVIDNGGLNVQGLFAAQDYLIVFVNGKAFFRNFANPLQTAFVEIPGFQMSPVAERIYCVLVPASTLNNVRLNSSQSDPKAVINFSNVGQPSPSCLICQDGVNQPFIIEPNGIPRVTKTFIQWSKTDREYVPKGLMMLYYDGVTYIVSPNRKEIYRSLRGRPLDFVIAVDNDGNKLADGIFEEEASRMSHRVDYEDIVCIRSLNSNDKGFLVSTLNNSYVVVPTLDYGTIFGEQQFDNIPLFATGPLNQEAITELLGDTALINPNGIRSFNAIKQSKNEGKDLPFYARVSDLFGGDRVNIVQHIACCINFKDYGLFACNTIHGSGILVFDTVKNVFVSLDKYPNVGFIRQFAVMSRTGGNTRLFFYDNNGAVYEYGVGDSDVGVFTKEFFTGSIEVEQKPVRFRILIKDIEADGKITAQLFVDGRGQEIQEQQVVSNITVPEYPLDFPNGKTDTNRVKALTFSWENAEKGLRSSLYLQWNMPAELLGVELVTDIEQTAVNQRRAANMYYGN